MLPILCMLYVLSQANGQCGCMPGACCSKWGYCGNGQDFCGAGCQSGPCIGSSPPSSPPSNGGSGTVRCGSNWADANNNCQARTCANNNDCNGQTCFKDLKSCGSSPPSQPPSSPPSSPPSNGGSVSSLISRDSFNRALGSCGVNRPDIYDALVGGFTARLPGGLNELALLIGNLAHESGAFQYTEEIMCAGVTQVTANCPYGLYHGRGYIQLSWQDNYRAAANYWNNQQILNNPDIVKNNPTVNWQTVQWFWTSSVQPVFLRSGYTLGASVRAINGPVECGNINAQRIKYIQCFQQNFGVAVDTNTQCPAAIGDGDSIFASGSSLTSAVPLALIVLGSIIVVLAIIAAVLVFLAMRKSKTGGERV